MELALEKYLEQQKRNRAKAGRMTRMKRILTLIEQHADRLETLVDEYERTLNGIDRLVAQYDEVAEGD